jgi:hypothetical protein
MSAYKKIKCNFVNKDSLVKALKVIGLNPICLEQAQNLRGYKNDIRSEKAEIIVPKEQLNELFTGLSNDLGFKWNETESKYDMICSDYDKANKMDERVIQAYAKTVLEEALEEQGYKIKINIEESELKNRKQAQINIVARKIV